MKARLHLTTAMVLLAMASAVLPLQPVAAAASTTVDLSLYPANPAMAACLPTAQAHARITPNPGNDSLTFHATGLMPLTGYDLLVTGSPTAPYGTAWPLGVAQADAQGTLDTQAQALLLRSDTATSGTASPAAHLVLFFDDPQDAGYCPGVNATPARVGGRLLGPAVLVTGAGSGGVAPLQHPAFQPPDFGISTPGGGRSRSNKPITFTIACSDPEGWAAIRFIDFRLSEHGTAVFMVRLDRPAKRLYVFDLTRARWAGGLPPGSAGSLDAALAQVVLPSSAVLGSTGTTGRLLLTLNFMSSASGRAFAQSVRVVDLRNQTRGWKESGSWHVD